MRLDQQSIDFVVRSLVRLGAAPSDLEDLAQDVMVTALTHQHAFDHARALQPWLWGIARNRLRDHRALARHRVEVHGEAEIAGAPPAGDRLLARKLDDALRELDDDVQVAIVLHDLEQWTLPECAQALGVTADTVKYRVTTGRKALRAALARGGSA